MQELIKITEQNGQQIVSARDLHQFLNSKKDFSDWIKMRINKYGLIDGVDFTTFQGKTSNGRPSTEYALTLDAAKELAMVEGNAKGKEARQYFIACEKKLREVVPVIPKSQSELILMIAQQNVLTEQRLTAIEEKVNEVAAKQIGSSTDYFSVAGYSSLRKQPIDNSKAASLSKRCWSMCQSLGYQRFTAHDPRFGSVWTYPREVLESVFNQHYPLMKRA